MDYLKYLLTTVIAVGILTFDVRSFNIGIGTFVMMGCIWGYLIKFRPITHSLAFTIWACLLVLWHFLINDAVHLNEVADPQNFTAGKKALQIGIGIIGGMIILHPISYGVSRLVIFVSERSLKVRGPLPNKSRTNFFKKCVVTISILILIVLLILTLITKSRLYVASGMFIVSLAKLYLTLSPLQEIKDTPSQNSNLEAHEFPQTTKTKGLLRKFLDQSDFPAVLLGILGAIAASSVVFAFGILLFSPSVYFYLGQDGYEKNAFPIVWELANGVIAGLLGGFLVSLNTKSNPLVKSVVAGSIYLAAIYFSTRDSTTQDPLWYTIMDNSLSFVAWILGGLLSIDFLNKINPDLLPAR